MSFWTDFLRPAAIAVGGAYVGSQVFPETAHTITGGLLGSPAKAPSTGAIQPTVTPTPTKAPSTFGSDLKKGLLSPQGMQGLFTAGAALGTSLLQQEEAKEAREASQAEKEKDREFQGVEAQKSREFQKELARERAAESAELAKKQRAFALLSGKGDSIAQALLAQAQGARRGGDNSQQGFANISQALLAGK